MGLRAALRAALLLPLALAGCGGGDGEHGAGASEGSGEAVFVEKCGACHTLAAARTSGTAGPNLDEHFAAHAHDAPYIAEQVRNGSGGMPGFEGKLSEAEIRAVAEYVFAMARR